MRTEKSIVKNEESEETGEVGRTIDGYKAVGAVKNEMEPTITLKGNIKQKRSI